MSKRKKSSEEENSQDNPGLLGRIWGTISRVKNNKQIDSGTWSIIN